MNDKKPPVDIGPYLEEINRERAEDPDRVDTIEEIEASIELVNAEIDEIAARGPEFVELEGSPGVIDVCKKLNLKVGVVAS